MSLFAFRPGEIEQLAYLFDGKPPRNLHGPSLAAHFRHLLDSEDALSCRGGSHDCIEVEGLRLAIERTPGDEMLGIGCPDLGIYIDGCPSAQELINHFLWALEVVREDNLFDLTAKRKCSREDAHSLLDRVALQLPTEIARTIERLSNSNPSLDVRPIM